MYTSVALICFPLFSRGAPSLMQKPKPNAYVQDCEQVQLLGKMAESRANITDFLSLLAQAA